uniref:Uncharacterized protein n=1 Tax=Marmota marmota marmota TaxID=9994 RepID=A0A8C6A2K4_MARMA
ICCLHSLVCLGRWVGEGLGIPLPGHTGATPVPFWLWRPVLRGPAWLTLCVLRCRRAMELGEHGSPDHILPHVPSPRQAAPGPRAFCIPRIILTECTPNPPSPPEARLEEPGPRTAPTPRPRTLTGNGRTWDGPLRAQTAWPKGSSMPEKEGTAWKSPSMGSLSPEDGRARVPCPWGPTPNETQEPSAAETHSEETSKDSGRAAQTCSGGQAAAGQGCRVPCVAPQRTDSLEETLRELEATLSEMGTAPAVGPPGISPYLLPHGPQTHLLRPTPSSFSCHHQRWVPYLSRMVPPLCQEE